MFDLDVPEQAVLDSIVNFGLDHVLVMPFPGARDAAAIHDRIAAMTTATEGKVRGIVNLNPHQDPDSYAAEAERCVRDHGFVALKLHTLGHAVDPETTDGAVVFDQAERLGVPVIIHTGGAGEPFASPLRVLEPARQRPGLSVVLAHSGMGAATHDACVVARLCPNVYLETSWCNVLDTAMIVRTIGAERMLLGSDAAENVGVEIAKHRALDISAEDREQCLGGTAARVFGL